MSTKKLHIATLECDIPVPNIYSQRGLYGNIFEKLLRDAQAASHENDEISKVELRFSQFDCMRGHLPSDHELENIDALLITGSCKSFSSVEVSFQKL